MWHTFCRDLNLSVLWASPGWVNIMRWRSICVYLRLSWLGTSCPFVILSKTVCALDDIIIEEFRDMCGEVLLKASPMATYWLSISFPEGYLLLEVIALQISRSLYWRDRWCLSVYPWHGYERKLNRTLYVSFGLDSVLIARMSGCWLGFKWMCLHQVYQYLGT